MRSVEPLLNRLNAVLIVLIGALVVYQWSGEGRADGVIVSLRAAGQKAERRIAEQTEALKQANEDLQEFKSVIAGLNAKIDESDVQLRQQKARVFTLERDAARTAAETASLKASLSAFNAAVQSRDTAIRTLLDQRRKLADAASDAAHRANGVVVQYNQLASQYQNLVGKYNDLVRRNQEKTRAAVGAQQGSKPQGEAGS